MQLRISKRSPGAVPASRRPLYKRVLVGEGLDKLPAVIRFRASFFNRCGNDLSHYVKIILFQAAGCRCRRSKAESGSDKRRLRVIRNRVLVCGDSDLIESGLDFFSGPAHVPQVHKHQMIVRSAGYKLNASVHKTIRKCLRVFHDLLTVSPEFRLKVFLEAYRLGGDHMHQGAALGARENGFVKLMLLCELRVRKDHASARSAQGLMGRCSCHMCIGNRARMKTRRNQSGNVRDIAHQVSADFIRDLAESLKIDRSGIGARAGNNQLRPAFCGNPLHFIIINKAVVIHAIGNNIEIGS